MKKIFFVFIALFMVIFASCSGNKEYTVTDFLNDYTLEKKMKPGKIVTDFGGSLQTVKAYSLMKSSEWEKIKTQIKKTNSNAVIPDDLFEIKVQGFAKSYILAYTVNHASYTERIYEALSLKGSGFVRLGKLASGPNKQLSFYIANDRTFVCEDFALSELVYSAGKISIAPAAAVFEEIYKHNFVMNKILTDEAFIDCQKTKVNSKDLPKNFNQKGYQHYSVYNKNGQKVIVKSPGNLYEIYAAGGKSPNKLYSGKIPTVFVLK